MIRVVYAALSLFWIIASIPASAGPSTHVSLSWSRSGVDSRGFSAFERFTLSGDRKVRVQTATRMSPCSSDGGTYEGSVSEAEAKALIDLALSAVKAEKSLTQEEAGSARAITSYLQVIVGEKASSSQVSLRSAEAREFEQARLRVMKSLKPGSVVSLSARRTGKGKLVARFTLTGNEPAAIILPGEAGEAFRLDGAPLEYADHHAVSTHEVRLTPEQRTHDVSLDPPKSARRPKDVSRLEYTNSVTLHHSEKDPMEGNLAPAPLALCADL